MGAECECRPYPPQDDTWAWERLIVAKPEMAVYFTGWDQLGGFAWARILSRRPEFADRCDWSKLKPLAWRQLLMRQPQFADKYDKWDEMRPFGGACGAITKGHEMREEGIVKRKEFKISILELEFRTSTSPPKPPTLFRGRAERKNFAGFAFMGRQRRITIDATDYKMDLLFFHRSLRRLIVVDLKIGKFKPEYKGQMELYLRYLNKNIRKPWEDKCKKY